MLSKEIVEALAKEFDPAEVDVKVQALAKDRTRGQVVAYIDARTVLDRLDEVVGPGHWQDSYEIIADRQDGERRLVEVRCRLTIMGITKEDVGEGDSAKAAFSDALKRAAVKFGVGRYLYRLPKVWADLDQYGNIKDREAVKAKLLGLSAPPAESGSAREAPPPSGERPAPSDGPSPAQLRFIHKLWKEMGAEGDDIHEYASAVLGREITSLNELSRQEASKLIDTMKEDAKAPL